MIIATAKATANLLLELQIQDSTKTDGSGLTGLTASSGGLKISYRVQGTTGGYTAIALTGTGTLGTYASGWFKEIDSANAPGRYELGVPNAAMVAANAGKVVEIYAFGGTNMVPSFELIQLTGADFSDSIALGLSRIDAAISSRATSITVPTNFSSLAIDGSGRVTVGSSADKTGYSLAQAFPTNFASLAIDGSGRVDLGRVLGTASAGAAGYMGLDWASVRAPASAVNLSGTTISTAQVVASVSGTVAANATQWGGVAVGSVVPGSEFTRAGTAQGGGASTITLDAGASAVNNFYQNQIVQIVSGTGAGQSALITAYAGGTKVATINGTWATNPDATSHFVLWGFGAIPASAGGSVTVGGYAAGQDPATQLLDAALAGHSGGGTVGAALGNLVNALGESYAANGTPATLTQLLYGIFAVLANVSQSGTSLVASKLDGATPAMSFTLDNATAPASRKRAA